MLNPRYIATFLAILLLLSGGPSAAWAVCTRGAQPCFTPMYYPGEMGMRAGCCPGPCMCVPNAATWGHFQKNWRQWPGEETRIDIRFPGIRGIEKLSTPKGQKPKDLPKEEYVVPQQPETGSGINIREGAPTTPIDTPTPFDFGSDELPGLDLPPEGPGPAGTGIPDAGGLQGLPSVPGPADDTVPPAPMPGESSSLPMTPEAAGPALESPRYAVSKANEKLQSAPVAPLPSFDEVPENPLVSAPVMNEPPTAPPIETKAVACDEKRSGTATAQSTVPNHKASPIPHESELATAPLPQSELPFSSAQAQAPGESKAWKSRRDQTPASATRTVDYEEPAQALTVMLDGYCPVELVRHEQWVDGNPQWEVQYKGRIYRLSGPAQKKLFQANPEQYVPVLSGNDPVLAVAGEGRVAGRTEACVIYRGRLLMFSSQKTVARFRQNPKRFMAELKLLEK